MKEGEQPPDRIARAEVIHNTPNSQGNIAFSIGLTCSPSFTVLGELDHQHFLLQAIQKCLSAILMTSSRFFTYSYGIPDRLPG